MRVLTFSLWRTEALWIHGVLQFFIWTLAISAFLYTWCRLLQKKRMNQSIESIDTSTSVLQFETRKTRDQPAFTTIVISFLICGIATACSITTWSVISQHEFDSALSSAKWNAIVPDPRATPVFIMVVAQMRSGSTEFVRDIAQVADIGNLGEIFNRGWNPPLTGPAIDRIEQYNRTLVFKVFDGHVSKQELTRLTRDVRICPVIVQRLNETARYCSYKNAVKSGEWLNTHARRKPCHLEESDSKQMHDFIRRAQASRVWYYDTIPNAMHNRRHIWFTDYDLFNARNDTIQSVIRFCIHSQSFGSLL